MPARLGTSGSVRARHTARSATCAQVVHTFWPVSTQPSPSRSARVASEARSDPAPGSLKSWHHARCCRRCGAGSAAAGPRCRGRTARAHRLSPSGLSRPSVVGRQLVLHRPRQRRRQVEAAVGRRPGGRHQARGRERRVPGLVVGEAAHLAQRPHRHSAAARQAAGTVSRTQSRTASTASSAGVPR